MATELYGSIRATWHRAVELWTSLPQEDKRHLGEMVGWYSIIGFLLGVTLGVIFN